MRPFSFATSGLGSTGIKPIIDVNFPRVIRFTIKVRTLGTNTYISLGNFSKQEFRLTAAGDSFTFVDIPPQGVDLSLIWAGGDNAANDGIIEVIGLVEP